MLVDMPSEISSVVYNFVEDNKWIILCWNKQVPYYEHWCIGYNASNKYGKY